MNSRDKIFLKLSLLIGSKLTRISHAADMIIFGFENEKTEYAFHCQTLVRIISENNILLTRNDYYDRENVDDEDSRNSFDLKVNLHFDYLKGNIVNNVEISEIGDITLILSHDIVIQVVMENSKSCFDVDYEQWRFFECGNSSSPHFVVYENMVIEEQ